VAVPRRVTLSSTILVYLSRIYWQDQQDNYWPIPYRNLALPPISLWEHDDALRRLKAESQRQVDENKLVAMILQQRRLVEEARSKTVRRRRGRQPPDDQCDSESDAGRLPATQSGVTAQTNRQESSDRRTQRSRSFSGRY